MSFEELHEALCAWYDRGDQGAFARFEQEFLRGATLAVLRRPQFGTLQAVHEDFAQTVSVHFMARDKAVGREAKSMAFWRGRIAFLAMRARREMGKNQEELFGKDEAVAALPAETDGLEALGVEISAERLRQSLEAGFGALSGVERLGFLVYHWHEVDRALIRAEDLTLLARRCGLSGEEIVQHLDATEGLEGGARVLFSADQLKTDRRRCLDTWRKARGRAYERLRLLIKREEGLP